MVSPPLYPLTFTPVLRDYVWGGRNLGERYGRSLPPAGPVAESWEISGHPNGLSRVEAGPWQGQTLPDVLASWGTDLVGNRAGWAMKRSRFPLLVKLLDAAQNLSVQVHPGDKYAQLHEGGELGKTEMWYVLHAQPGAQIILGLQPDISAEELGHAIAADRLEACLQRLPVKPGDAVFIAAGTLHALLAGVMAVEVEQNSDTTYRMYDWGRLGADGRPRPLHIAKGLEVIDFRPAAPGVCRPLPRVAGRGIIRQEISRCPYFVVEKLQIEPEATFAGRTDGQTLEIWGTVEGEAGLLWAGGPAVPLPAIRFCLVPARLGEFGVRAITAATMLRVYLP